VNDRKTAANQPDFKGKLEISWALFQELNAAFNAGQYEQDGGGQPCLKLDLALYAQQPGVSASGRARPILSGTLSTVTETQHSAAMRQQAAAQYQQPQQPAYAQPQAPAPQPQYAQPQQPQAPMPQQQYAPAAAPQAPQQPCLGCLGSGLTIPEIHQLPLAHQILRTDGRSLLPAALFEGEQPQGRARIRH
jgi:hypothetical protein